MNSAIKNNKVDPNDLVTRDCEVFDRYVRAVGEKPKEFKGTAAKFREHVKDMVAEVLIGPEDLDNIIFDPSSYHGDQVMVLEFMRRYMEYLIYNGTLADFRGELTRRDRLYLEDINLFQVRRYLKDLKDGLPRLVAQLKKQKFDVAEVITKLEKELERQSH